MKILFKIQYLPHLRSKIDGIISIKTLLIEGLPTPKTCPNFLKIFNFDFIQFSIATIVQFSIPLLS
jgi:hypothetical protein